MNRLTKNGKLNYKRGTGLHLEYKDYASEETKEVVTNINKVFDKLSKLEDIEERIGCPLEVIDKALREGIYIVDLPHKNLIRQFVQLSSIEDEWFLSNEIMGVNVKDYKNYFWLKEDRGE